MRRTCDGSGAVPNTNDTSTVSPARSACIIGNAQRKRPFTIWFSANGCSTPRNESPTTTGEPLQSPITRAPSGVGISTTTNFDSGSSDLPLLVISKNVRRYPAESACLCRIFTVIDPSRNMSWRASSDCSPSPSSSAWRTNLPSVNSSANCAPSISVLPANSLAVATTAISNPRCLWQTP